MATIKEFQVKLNNGNTLVIHNNQPIYEVDNVFDTILRNNSIFERIESDTKDFGPLAFSLHDKRVYKQKNSKLKIQLSRNMDVRHAGIVIILPIIKGRICKNADIKVIFDDNSVMEMQDYIDMLALTIGFKNEYHEYTRKITITDDKTHFIELIKLYKWYTDKVTALEIYIQQH